MTFIMEFLPINIRVSDAKILIVGGGKVATHKALILSRFTNNVTVLAPMISDEIKRLPFRKIEKEFSEADLDGVNLLYVCTGDHARSTDGVFQINPDGNATALLIRAVRRLGCIPKPLENQIIDYTPVDIAAQRAASFINDTQSPIIQRVAPVRQYSLNHIKKVPTDEFLRRLEELPEEMRLPMQLFIKNLGYYSV